MNAATRITADPRFVGIGTVALALAAIAIVIAVALGTAASTAVKLPPVMQDRSAVEYERFAVTHGVYAATQPTFPVCSGPVVSDERDAVRRGIYPRGLAAIEFCAHQTDNTRELDAIRRARSAQVGVAEGSWSIDWHNFHGRQ